MSSSNAGPLKGDPQHAIHIFVNRQPFNNPPDRRVMPTMTGAQIAALVDVAPDNAIVRREKDGTGPEVGINETVPVESGDHFVVTRKHVDGGFVGVA
jgi:hypothetical protein